MKKRNNTILWVARILVGLLFIFSGLIKLNDPLGFSYKLEEYFEVFHLIFLNQLAVFLSIFLCALEVIFGVLLLTGFYAKKVAWGLLLLIVFFTFLTFYSAFFDVVKTCGCFGDAIPLTPWQSFSKDLVLLIFIVFIFIKKDDINPLSSNKSVQFWSSTLVVVLTVLFGLYTYTFLPIIDFLPYKVGVSIPNAMKIPEGAPQDEYVIIYTLKNKKTSEQKEMTDKEYLQTKIYENKDWELVSSSAPKLVKAGYQPKIKDLNIYDSQGVNYTQEILDNPYYNLVAVAWNLDKTNQKSLGDINAIAINAVENFNIRTILLTSNSAQDAGKLSKKIKLMMEVFYADAVPLKSMVRSNPGLILLKNGIVINKWPASALPDYNQLSKAYFSKNE
ncbi:MAG: DoxX family protein [Bacteroidetes bacterium]|nr:DoxX family protein [Bacteroidota bacterium]MBU1483877.1 DoxX family protein [Bacteroidota bacterium]MBU2269653.1 DoxX family protein [Bacteroidota bacterium]MBU2375627.1 DoxX family protein [Bacteroidota bacterium]